MAGGPGTNLLSAQAPDSLLFKQAQQRFAEGKYFRVLDVLDSLLQKKPDFAPAYFLKGLTEYRLQNVKAALANFDLAIAYKPNYLEAYYNRGLLEAGTQQYDKAIENFDKLLMLNPEIGPAYLQRALAHLARGQAEAARNDFRETVRRLPNSPEAHFHLARLEREGGDSLQAARHLQTLFQIQPQHEAGLLLATEWLLEAGRYAELEATCTTLLALNPYQGKARLGRGIAAFYTQKWSEAEADLNQVLAKEKENAQAWWYRGRLKQALGDLTGACADWKMAQNLGNLEATTFLQKFCRE
ncbi:MAG: hypothetical protein OHK0053_29440 [Microscillaceae bacterium]